MIVDRRSAIGGMTAPMRFAIVAAAFFAAITDMAMFRRLHCFAFILFSAVIPTAAAQTPVTVAAASDLKYALEEIVSAYEGLHGAKLRLVFGASGNLMRQIAQGAPYEIYLSADEQYVHALHQQGHTLDEGERYAIGHLVLFVPKGSPVKADALFADLKSAMADGRLKKLAIANPEHAPYGRAARSALEANGLWEPAQGKLVMGENVSQAAQYAASGAAQAGLFALSLAVTPNFRAAGDYVVLPAAWHAPLNQRMVLLKRAGAGAKQFYVYLQTPAARAIFKRYGFALPGE